MLTLDVKTVLLGILIIALIVLVIYIIVLIANALKALKRVVLILEDAQAVSAIVANRADQLDEGVDGVIESVSNFKDGFKDKLSATSPKTWISNISDIRNAGSTVRDIVLSFSGLAGGARDGISGRAKRTIKSEQAREERRTRGSRFAPSRRNQINERTAERRAERRAVREPKHFDGEDKK